jgi:hypothetical protein
MVRCGRCGLLRSDPILPVAELARLYEASEFIEPVSGTDEQLPQDATEVDPIAPAADSQPSDDDAVQPDAERDGRALFADTIPATTPAREGTQWHLTECRNRPSRRLRAARLTGM